MQVLTGSQRFWFDSYTDALGEVLERIGVPGIKKTHRWQGMGAPHTLFRKHSISDQRVRRSQASQRAGPGGRKKGKYWLTDSVSVSVGQNNPVIFSPASPGRPPASPFIWVARSSSTRRHASFTAARSKSIGLRTPLPGTGLLLRPADEQSTVPGWRAGHTKDQRGSHI